MKIWFVMICVCLFRVCIYGTEPMAINIPGIVKEVPDNIRSVKIKDGYMVPYTVKLTDAVSFEMIPIPGGRFKLGSPESEKGRNKDEGPQVEVEIEPFWMGKCEVTWGEYKQWMEYVRLFMKPDGKTAVAVDKQNTADAVTAPSTLYDPSYTFGHGEDPQLPAATMSQFAARQYTKWLSKKTGQFFRLPNEAEWEYACRAGTTTVYGYGDDPKKIDEYAWTAANSKEKPHYVGLKKPNPWGLHDMHGNLMEWTLDGYNKEGYPHLKKSAGRGVQLTNWPTKMFHRTLRGGAFAFDPELARSAARIESEEGWYEMDPNVPRGPFWLTDDPARAVGMRVIRTLEQPQRTELERIWEADEEDTKHSLEDHLGIGKGAKGVVIPNQDAK